MWGKEQEASFEELKSKLAAKPVLKVYNPKVSRTELHTDASAVGLGDVAPKRYRERSIATGVCGQQTNE